jgi:hypothetical protein
MFYGVRGVIFSELTGMKVGFAKLLCYFKIIGVLIIASALGTCCIGVF